MKITFLGTGTSMGIPMLGCHCAVCRSSDPRDKRLRASVWLQAGNRHLIIDTGIDFRQQALRAGIPTVDAVLFTHHHVDHIFGLDELRAFNIRQGKDIPIYAREETMGCIRRVYKYIFDGEEKESDIPRIEAHVIDETPFLVRGIPVTPISLWHGSLPIFGYRIGNFAYCTDVSRIPDRSVERLQGLDVLVLGALRHRPHPTHFTIEQAVEAARTIGARQTYLTHMSHAVSHRELAESLPPEIQPARDELSIEIDDPDTGLPPVSAT